MDVRVHVVAESRDYQGGLIVKDIASIVFNAPGNVVPVVHQKRVTMLDLYVNEADVTVKQMHGTDALVVTFV